VSLRISLLRVGLRSRARSSQAGARGSEIWVPEIWVLEMWVLEI
jgi:hypothetical protein